MTAPMPDRLPAGIWVGASIALGRDVPTDEPYPHICGRAVQGQMSWITVQLGWKECAACAEGRPR